jgi:HK97 family phage major capsid protein
MNYVGPSTTGSNPFVVPEQGPAVLPLGAMRPRLQDLIQQSTIDSDTFKYARLTGRPTDAEFVQRTTSVDPGNEDGLLPLGNATFELVTDTVRNLGEGLPVHATSFMDAGELQGILEQLLDFDLARTLEANIYGGDGEGENLPGIKNTAGINSIAYNGGYNAIEQIKRGITAIRIAGEEPGWVGLHPNDDDVLAFLRDGSGGAGTGSYLAGNPFSGQSQTIWGLPRVAADVVTEGKPLVGSTYGARLRVRSGVSYSVSDSHKDWFMRQVLLLRAVMRVGLGVERPKSFAEVDIAA